VVLGEVTGVVSQPIFIRIQESGIIPEFHFSKICKLVSYVSVSKFLVLKSKDPMLTATRIPLKYHNKMVTIVTP
jgi:hypothetical protein